MAAGLSSTSAPSFPVGNVLQEEALRSCSEGCEQALGALGLLGGAGEGEQEVAPGFWGTWQGTNPTRGAARVSLTASVGL